MKHETNPTDPLAWLSRAKSNLKLAELGDGVPEEYQRVLGLAQQVVSWAESVLGHEVS